MRLRFLASVVFVFLLLSSLEAWAGFWLAGRWFISSRYASVSLGTVKSWLDRGIINSRTQWARIFVNRYGKWIILTIGLSQVIPEVERLRNSTSVCYLAGGNETVRCFVGTLYYFFCYGTGTTRDYFTMSPEILPRGDTCGLDRSIPAYSVFVWRSEFNYWQRLVDRVPANGRHFIGRNSSGWECYLNVSVNIPPCPFPHEAAIGGAPVSGYPPSQADWTQRRRIPVRVFPNPLDFLRDDVIARDPALQWLRDEYQRLASDSSIPTIPVDLLGDLELPTIDWSISPDEAIDHVSERGSTAEGSEEGSVDVSVPGLDTKLDPVQKKPFPVELINQLVQNHPLLRILSSVSLDAAGGGSCVIGSEPFIIDMCGWQWVLNLMGSFLVPLAFLFGLGIGGRSEG
jgi:hypothetical protein